MLWALSAGVATHELFMRAHPPPTSDAVTRDLFADPP
jgi:hypothetical protein